MVAKTVIRRYNSGNLLQRSINLVSTEKKELSEEEIKEFRLSNMSTEDKVLSIRRKIPTIPPVEIAKVLGISREWARKLLERNGKPTNLLRLGKFCNECGKKLERLPKRGMCRNCWSVMSKVDVDCAGCGTPIKVAKPLYDRAINNNRYRGNFYCSRPCFDSNKGPYQRQQREIVAYTHVCQTCGKEEQVFGAYEKRKALNRKYCKDCRLARYNHSDRVNMGNYSKESERKLEILKAKVNA